MRRLEASEWEPECTGLNEQGAPFRTAGSLELSGRGRDGLRSWR